MSDPDMKLPDGKSCADCIHYRRCRLLIGSKYINERATHCDWAPSRFVAKLPDETAMFPMGMPEDAD